jgi:hypothetical protein
VIVLLVVRFRIFLPALPLPLVAGRTAKVNSLCAKAKTHFVHGHGKRLP